MNARLVETPHRVPISTKDRPKAADAATAVETWLDRHAVAALVTAVGAGVVIGWLVKRGVR